MKSVKTPRYTMSARAEGVATTRDRIVRAALKLALEQAYETITLAEIARAARVSHQTVLNHFDSKEGAFAAAAAVLADETRTARARAMPGDAKRAVTVLVGDYERMGDANARWAIASERLGSLAPLLDEARQGHAKWLERIFGESLPSTPAARRRALHGLHAATDVYTWKLLRRDLRLSRAETEQIMVDLVRGILRSTTVSKP